MSKQVKMPISIFYAATILTFPMTWNFYFLIVFYLIKIIITHCFSFSS